MECIEGVSPWGGWGGSKVFQGTLWLESGLKVNYGLEPGGEGVRAEMTVANEHQTRAQILTS